MSSLRYPATGFFRSGSLLCSLFLVISGLPGTAQEPPENPPVQWITYDGYGTEGYGRHIVLISGDEEYRSEEALPQLAKILAVHHGFKCTVLFAQDPARPGIVNPQVLDNIPGLEALRTAQLMVIATRFRALPDAQMEEIDNYLRSGRPVIGLRTANHGFRFPVESKWHHYSVNKGTGPLSRKVLLWGWVIVWWGNAGAQVLAG
ncbi:MAG: hypothetical protein ACC661_04400 [Verrucomicrobiales bacterium]